MAHEEPDYRFTLANERTFLAWIRTALGLLAASVVVGEVSASSVQNHRALTLLGILCTVVATLMSVSAFSRWRRVQEAIRRRDPLPSPALILRVTVLAVCVSAAVCTAVLIW